MVGLRDEIVIRLGLVGLRLSEIGSLTLDDLRHLPTITWTGKGHKPKKATAGSALCDALDRYLGASPDPQPSSPLLCRQIMGAARQGGPRRLDWHRRAGNRTLFYVVNERAKAAGLGHVAPHDLRRTAAGILHSATATPAPRAWWVCTCPCVPTISDQAVRSTSRTRPRSPGRWSAASSCPRSVLTGAPVGGGAGSAPSARRSPPLPWPQVGRRRDADEVGPLPGTP